ncbi:amidase [Corynebacterium sp. HS2168-gen11]|uniref:amidase n=1 Tax=Corynebacterium sp. HS2168-gen11 TaxID=2974027 RepID=UPI00216AF6AC|nr:amidase [Corynebacterium sp. HS2168-gen11]MCS4535953.1 amidase [Corynebacterium sp. HS2168-gen11]
MDVDVSTFWHRILQLSPAEHGFSYLDPTAQPPQTGRLSGWIIPAKDLSDVAGMPTSFGNASRRRLAHKTDPFIAAYQQQGAYVPGKTATSELGLSAYTEPVGQAHPENPLWPGHTPGGSSGGAAVAVARGLVRAAHASDGGGSIRVPAACTGMIGFKPAHDTTGANPVAQGFITATLADAAFLHTITPPAKLRPLRIGVLATPVHAPVEVATHYLDALEYAATTLAAHGHTITTVQPPYGPAPFAAFHTLLAYRARKISGEASPLVDWLRETGRRLRPHQVATAMEEFFSVHAQLRAAWDCDVLLCPTLAFDPPPIGYFSSLDPAEDFYTQTQWTPWATMFNMSGDAALSMPVSSPYTSIQLAALRIDSAELFALATCLDAPLQK